jgi:hypothetical protein
MAGSKILALQRLVEQRLVAALGAIEVDGGNLEPDGNIGIEHGGGPGCVRIARRQDAGGLLPAFCQ